jgi:hypothetical protein
MIWTKELGPGDHIAGREGIISATCRVSEHLRSAQRAGRAGIILAAMALLVSAAAWAGQTEAVATMAALPDAPDPQIPASSPPPKKEPCPRTIVNGAAAGSAPGVSPDQTGQSPVPCKITWGSGYELFANGPQEKPLTPKDKAWLAARNVVDPFNALTILGVSAYSVGKDSHSAYGPGMAGFGRYVGVSYTQDMIGEFFGTFLIPTIAHQDPHYHRIPEAKIPRRILHATYQVFWTQSDSGHGMLNYANLVGFAISDEISNLYVPGRETDASATASRYVIGLATAPIGNYIIEFVPDVARHIHIQVVILQRIINQVAKEEGGQP